MTLLDIRKMFIQSSGRYDLVVDTTGFVDAGANRFIQAGQKFLDRLPFDHPQAKKSIVLTPTAPGQTEFAVPNVRAIYRVRGLLVGGGARLLRETDIAGLDALTVGYPAQIGPPQYFASFTTRTAGVETGRGVRVWPGTSPGVTFVVDGLFFSTPLLIDTDESFWSREYPMTLVSAAWYMLERFYRNSEGMKDHLNAIREDLQGIDFDAVEEMLEGEGQLRDSW